MKIGRNQKCPCGSGVKYKKCHYPKSSVEILRETNSRPEYIDVKGRLVGRPFIQTEFQGKRVRAVGSRLYPKQQLKETFHEFIIIILKDVLGKKWGLAESSKPLPEQHIIVRWLSEMGQLQKSPNARIENKEGIKSIAMTGNVRSLICLAYDIYTIFHSGEIPSKLLKRLKSMNSFQGARYEIAVAALFVRAGFKIQWVEKKSEKHCEFIATHKTTQEQIAVEAKSRHRAGVLGMEGEETTPDELKTGVARMFNQAIKQLPVNMASTIFIDLNLPLTANVSIFDVYWFKELKKFISDRNSNSYESPDEFSALYVTNFSWHYSGNQATINKGESIMVVPRYSVNPIKDSRTLDLLHTSANQYGHVPHEV